MALPSDLAQVSARGRGQDVKSCHEGCCEGDGELAADERGGLSRPRTFEHVHDTYMLRKCLLRCTASTDSIAIVCSVGRPVFTEPILFQLSISARASHDDK